MFLSATAAAQRIARRHLVRHLTPQTVPPSPTGRLTTLVQFAGAAAVWRRQRGDSRSDSRKNRPGRLLTTVVRLVR